MAIFWKFFSYNAFYLGITIEGTEGEERSLEKYKKAKGSR
jgi:hypothetical protein